jgi:hypothetical protein
MAAPSRFRVLDLVSRLDPERDHLRIVRLSGCWDFPWDVPRSLEMALLRTFAVPSIGGLLHTTARFAEAPQRRYDDTTLLIAELVEWGYVHPRGRAALERMNAIHGRFRISNDDYRYVLSTFVLEPMRWNARFGWRPLSRNERIAGFVLWREIGRRMGIRDIPDDLAGLEELNVAYEREHFRRVPGGMAVAAAGRDLLLGWYLPPALRGLGARVLAALLDEPLLDAFGWPVPTAAERRAVEGALRARSRALRAMPGRTHPHLSTMVPTRSYPEGYRIGALGPPPADLGDDAAAAMRRPRGVS